MPDPDIRQRILAAVDTAFEEQLAFSPIQQTFLGRKSSAIDDMSLAAQDKQRLDRPGKHALSSATIRKAASAVPWRTSYSRR